MTSVIHTAYVLYISGCYQGKYQLVSSAPSRHAGSGRATPVLSPQTVTLSWLLAARATQHIFLSCQFLCLPMENRLSFTKFGLKAQQTGRNGDNWTLPSERSAFLGFFLFAA